MTIVLYELQPTRSARVRWTLLELGIPFESIEGREVFAMPELAQIHPMSKLPALRLLNANEWREALRLLIGVAVGVACLTQAAAGYGVIALGVAFIGLFGGLIVSPTPGRLGRRRFLSAGHSG